MLSRRSSHTSAHAVVAVLHAGPRRALRVGAVRQRVAVVVRPVKAVLLTATVAGAAAVAAVDQPVRVVVRTVGAVLRTKGPTVVVHAVQPAVQVVVDAVRTRHLPQHRQAVGQVFAVDQAVAVVVMVVHAEAFPMTSGEASGIIAVCEVVVVVVPPIGAVLDPTVVASDVVAVEGPVPVVVDPIGAMAIFTGRREAVHVVQVDGTILVGVRKIPAEALEAHRPAVGVGAVDEPVVIIIVGVVAEDLYAAAVGVDTVDLAVQVVVHAVVAHLGAGDAAVGVRAVHEVVEVVIEPVGAARLPAVPPAIAIGAVRRPVPVVVPAIQAADLGAARGAVVVGAVHPAVAVVVPLIGAVHLGAPAVRVRAVRAPVGVGVLENEQLVVWLGVAGAIVGITRHGGHPEPAAVIQPVAGPVELARAQEVCGMLLMAWNVWKTISSVKHGPDIPVLAPAAH